MAYSIVKCCAGSAVALLCSFQFAGAEHRNDPLALSNPVTKGLIHWWKFDGNADDSAGDLSATPIGPVSYPSTILGYGIEFNGTTTGISLPPARDLQFRKSFSISVWASLKSYPTFGQIWATIIFDGDDRVGLDPFDLRVSPTGNLQFLLTGETRGSVVYSPVSFPLNKFVYVTVTYDKSAGILRLFMDGTEVGTIRNARNLTPVVKLAPNAFAGVGIGTNNGFPKSQYNMGWSGILSDLRIYNRSLSSIEVRSLYRWGR